MSEQKNNGQEMNVAVYDKQADDLQEMVNKTKITNEQELGEVSNIIRKIKEAQKKVRKAMEEWTKPAMAVVRKAQSVYLPVEKRLKQVEADLKNKAEAYMAEEEKKRKEKEDSIAKRAEKGQLKEETAMRKMEEIGDEKKSVSTGESTITRKMVKVAEIVDPALVPKEYWIIDEARVKKAALAGAVIPGVEVREKPQMSVR